MKLSRRVTVYRCVRESALQELSDSLQEAAEGGEDHEKALRELLKQQRGKALIQAMVDIIKLPQPLGESAAVQMTTLAPSEIDWAALIIQLCCLFIGDTDPSPVRDNAVGKVRPLGMSWNDV